MYRFIGLDCSGYSVASPPQNYYTLQFFFSKLRNLQNFRKHGRITTKLFRKLEFSKNVSNILYSTNCYVVVKMLQISKKWKFEEKNPRNFQKKKNNCKLFLNFSFQFYSSGFYQRGFWILIIFGKIALS